MNMLYIFRFSWLPIIVCCWLGWKR